MGDEYIIKFIVVVRSDLGMGKGKIAGQVGHAVTDMVCCNLHYTWGNVYYKDDTDTKNRMFEDWINKFNQTKVILKVNSEQELLDLMEKVKENDYIWQFPIRDIGKTQIEKNTLTCCGFGPNHSYEMDKYFADLKLL